VRTIKSLALGAGLGFILLAILIQGILPWLTPESRDRRVTRAVRNDLGAVKWVWYEASDYTPLEQRGRRVYIREGCLYCHSQYVRPVTGEDLRWGPVSQAGEYHFDAPHLFSTRRIGPDLTRVGLKLADGWHYAHHWDPQMVVPDSNMPAFRWLFHQVRVPVRTDGDRQVLGDQPELGRYFTMAAEPEVPVFPTEAGLAFADPGGREAPIPGRPVLELGHFHDEPPVFGSITLVVPSADLVGLVAYVQKLGTNRGAWREVFEPQNLAVGTMRVPVSERLVERGREVYMRRCVGCHGEKGDGNGPAATFLQPRPRDFTVPAFKFRTTPSGSLPTDGDLFRTITRGVRWTAMPTWHELHEKDRLAVIQFLKTFAADFWREPGEPPIVIPEPPAATPELVARGKELFRTAKCWECHGDEGKGDGPSAGQLRTDDRLPIRPTDFTRGQFKGGSDVRDVFRTMTTGLNGTPMPSFADSMKEDERWAISYFVLSLSAFVDPLTGRRLEIDPQTRAALNRPETARESRLAHDPGRAGQTVAGPPEYHRYRYGIRGGPKE
jgi:cytochrome c oxidase cbb3-type subunit 2